MNSFDAKINTENLTKCLQTLKQFYGDLLKDKVKGVSGYHRYIYPTRGMSLPSAFREGKKRNKKIIWMLPANDKGLR